VWNNLLITADIIFRPTMTHIVVSLRGQLDIQRQALRHDMVTCILVVSGLYITGVNKLNLELAQATNSNTIARTTPCTSAEFPNYILHKSNQLLKECHCFVNK
jgi:hypothetical protein